MTSFWGENGRAPPLEPSAFRHGRWEGESEVGNSRIGGTLLATAPLQHGPCFLVEEETDRPAGVRFPACVIQPEASEPCRLRTFLSGTKDGKRQAGRSFRRRGRAEVARRQRPCHTHLPGDINCTRGQSASGVGESLEGATAGPETTQPKSKSRWQEAAGWVRNRGREGTTRTLPLTR